MEVPDIPEIKEAIAVQEDECLRHYLHEAFFKPEDPEKACNAFLQTLTEDRSTSIQTWIWEMQAKQTAWHKKVHGTHGYGIMARTNQPFIKQAE